MFRSKKLFTDVASSTPLSRKLRVQKYCPFEVLEPIGGNAIHLELRAKLNIHPVIQVEHTFRVFDQLPDITALQPTPCQPFVDEFGESVIEVSEILAQKRQGRGWKFLTLYKDSPINDIERKPLRDFIDDDKTITTAFISYITEYSILPHYR